MRSRLILAALLPAVVLAASPAVEQARQLYQQTEYLPALDLLKKVPAPDLETLLLTGQTYYRLGSYSEATEVLERAARLAPASADVQVWLGRAWGRRAETSAVWNQLRYAGRTRAAFERAVDLDPESRTALADLFEFYVEAPGVAGGGLEKAAKLVPRIAALDAAWGESAQARIDEKRNDFNSAERHLRRALEIAPAKAGPWVDLARFLARRGRTEESDAAFARATQIAPDDPDVWFARAKTYVEKNRNAAEARQLLDRYLGAPLTPDHPPRDEARLLLARIGRR